MFESWMVGIAFRATSNVARVMSQSSQATDVANRSLSRQNTLLEEHRKKVLAARAAIAGGIAFGGALAIGVGIKQAADLQQAMTSVGIATGLAGDQLQRFYGLALNLSNITAQSVTTIAQEMSAAATSGLNSPGRLFSAFPEIAKAADVLMLSPKHIDPVQAVTQMSTLAHLFAAYKGKALHDMIDAGARMMFVQPENMDAIVRQGRMFIPEAMSLLTGHDNSPASVRNAMSQIFTQLMTMGQTGFLKSRGGSGIARFMEFLMGAENLTNHMSKARRNALKDMGVFDSHGRLRFVDEKSRLSLDKAVQYLGELRKTMDPGRFMTDVMNAFGAQGGRYIMAITRPEVQAQMGQNQLALSRIAPPGQAVETMWTRYANTFNFAWRAFVTNLANVLGATFLPVLPALTKGLKGAALELGKLTSWLFKHPKEASAIAVAAFGAVVWSAGIAVASLWRLNTAIMAVGVSSAASAGAATSFWGAMDSVFLFGLGKRILPVLDRVGGVILGLPTPLSAAAKGLLTLNGALTTLGTILGAGSALGATIALLYGAQYDAKKYPHQKFDRATDLNRGITNPGDFPVQVDIFGRVKQGVSKAPYVIPQNTPLDRLNHPYLQRTGDVVNVHIDNPHYHLGPGTPKEQAEKVHSHLQSMVEHARHHGATTGVRFSTHPYGPRAGLSAT